VRPPHLPSASQAGAAAPAAPSSLHGAFGPELGFCKSPFEAFVLLTTLGLVQEQAGCRVSPYLAVRVLCTGGLLLRSCPASPGFMTAMMLFK